MGKNEKQTKPDAAAKAEAKAEKQAQKAAKKAAKPRVSKETKRRFLKKGTYSFALCVIVIAVVVALNLLAGQLPASLNQKDISAQKLYSLSDQTKEMLSNLKEDITIYILAASGNEDDILMKTLQQYENTSSHIKVETKDPDLNPAFVSQYTDQDLTTNSLIVVCGDQSRAISYEDIYETSVDYSTYQTQTTGFDGEGQITSAINILTSENVPVLYTLTGHDELEMSDSLKSLIEKENISVQSLSLLTEEAVPDDCAMLLILSPTKDLSEDDAKKIKTYMEGGGKAVVVSYYSTTETPNLDSVMAEYGLGVDKSVMLEEDPSHYAVQNPLYVVPEIISNDYTSDVASGSSFVLAPVAQPVLQGEATDEITYTTLLKSSSTSYAKKNAANVSTYEREDGDEMGPFSIATVAEKTKDEVTSKMVVIGTESLFDADVNTAVSGTNYSLILNVLSRLSEHQTTTAIPVKSLTYEALNITTAKSILWRNVLMFLVPSILLVAGIVIWFRRRKR